MSFLSWGDIFTLPLGGDRIMELKHLHIGQCTDAVDAGIVPEVHQNDASAQLAETQRRRIQPNASDLGRAHLAFFNSHSDCSSFLPTTSAQYWTSVWSSVPNAAAKWLSISSSPATCFFTKMGTTISDLVSREQAR